MSEIFKKAKRKQKLEWNLQHNNRACCSVQARNCARNCASHFQKTTQIVLEGSVKNTWMYEPEGGRLQKSSY